MESLSHQVELLQRRQVAHRLPRRLWQALAFTSATTIVSSAALAGYVVQRITGPTTIPSTQTFTPFELGVDWEPVRVPSAGTTLSGWWFRREQSDAVIIGCHGYRGSKADLLGIAAGLWRQGCEVLLFDYRGHGDHSGVPVTLGYQEVQDVQAAVHFVQQIRPTARIGLLGYSMGAAAAIMAAAREPAVAAVVADSPFAAQRNPVLLQLRRTLHSAWSGPFVLFLADLILRARLGFGFRDVEPLREVGAIAPRPLLLIHGLADTIIDAADSQRLYLRANDPKELWLLPGVDHCGAYFQDRQYYVERVWQFYRQTLNLTSSGAARTA